MSETKKKPPLQTYNLEIPQTGELRLELGKPKADPKTAKSVEDTVNEDLIRRVINRLKNM